MVIEYRIRFEKDGVRVTQSVDLDSVNAKDGGGNPGADIDPGGNPGANIDDGGNPGSNIDDGGNPGSNIDDGGNPGSNIDDGGAGGGSGRPVVVIFGPVVIGNAGRAGTNAKGNPIKKPKVFGLGAVRPQDPAPNS